MAVHGLTASHFLLWPPDVLERSGGDFRKGAEGTGGWESIGWTQIGGSYVQPMHVGVLQSSHAGQTGGLCPCGKG